MLRLAAAALALLASSASATDSATFVVELVDGRTLVGECAGLRDGRLAFQPRDGRAEDLHWPDILGLHAPPLPPLPPPSGATGIEPPSPSLPPADDVLLLAGGDVLVGRVTGSRCASASTGARSTRTC